MGKRNSVSPTIRAQAFVLYENGLTQREIAEQLKISQKAVHVAIKKHESTNGRFCDAPRSGRPRATTKRDERYLKLAVQRNPSVSLPVLVQGLKATGTTTSTSTLSRRLSKEMGLRSYRPAHKPRLTVSMVKKRLAFARKYAHWTAEQWDTVMWTDECSIEQFGSRQLAVRRPTSQRYNPRYVVQTMKHPVKQMIWGSISSQGRGGLFFLPKGKTMNASTYLDLLKEKLSTHMTIHSTGILMHDGAPCHRAKVVSQWLDSEDITVLEWPGNSPDCNPIENAWNKLKSEVAAMKPRSLDHLKECIKLAWTTKITPEYCRRLVHSMPSRLASIIEARGQHTKY